MTAICRLWTGERRFFFQLSRAGCRCQPCFVRDTIVGYNGNENTGLERRQVLDFSGYGRLPKWPTGADCKSAGYAFDGSNPSPTTTFYSAEKSAFYPMLAFVFSPEVFLRVCFLAFARFSVPVVNEADKPIKSHSLS